MKKILALTLCLTLCLALLASCGKKDPAPTEGGDTPKTETITIKVGASPAPHAEILEAAKEVLAEKNINLDIVVFNDYIQPNMATESGDVIANYFQHIDYLNSFNPDNNTHLVNVAEIHYEPYGLYPGKTASIDALSDGATIAVPNDPSNEARALLLLEAQGLIKIKEGVGLKATPLDVVENPKNLKFKEIEAAQLTKTLSSVDMAVINGNYAIEANLSAEKDALAIEDASPEAKKLYTNILVVKEGNEDKPEVKALIEALKSDKVRDFITEKYEGAVVPLF